MGHKNQSPITLNFQSVDPRTGFLPTHPSSGSTPSGVATGTMSSTNAIYSQILDVSRMDNLGLELKWTGTPTGTVVMLASVSGVTWGDVTSLFASPAISNPAGSANGSLAGYKQYEYKYFLLKYTNASGTGVLTGYLQMKDLN